jgi:hypothetical protein
MNEPKKFYRDRVIVNQAQCKLCGDIIESKYGHDYVRCKCGEIAVDGGKGYLRRTAGDLANIIDLSEVVQEERPPYEWEIDDAAKYEGNKR